MAVLFLTSSFVIAGPVIIVNNSVSDSVDASTAQKIYLGKKSKWDNGASITAVTLSGGGVHDAFLDQYIKKTSAQFDTYWKQMIFSGKGVPPKSFASEKELIDFVSQTAGAIGYVDSTTPMENVKVIQ